MYVHMRNRKSKLNIFNCTETQRGTIFLSFPRKTSHIYKFNNDKIIIMISQTIFSSMAISHIQLQGICPSFQSLCVVCALYT